MQMITAIVQPSRLDQVREALESAGVEGMTISEVRGYGRQKGHKEIYRGAEYTIHFVPKIKIEVAVKDAVAEAAIKAISEAANTNKIGDGKIFVQSLDKAIRIRTGEEGEQIL